MHESKNQAEERYGLLKSTTQIHYLFDHMMSELMRAYHGNEFTPAQMRIALSLMSEDGLSMRELGDRNCLQKTTLSTMMPKMVDCGLVSIEADSCDKRVKIVRLTEKGRSILTTHMDMMQRVEETVFNGIRDEEVAVVVKILGKIKGNMIKENQ